MLLLYTIRPIKIFISGFGQKLLFMLFGQIDKLYVSAKIRFSIYFFFQIIRTNNDAEGWHNKLNSKGKGAGLHFYELVDLLFAESEFVQVEEAYLKQNQTTRHQINEYTDNQSKAFRSFFKITHYQCIGFDGFAKSRGVY